MTTTDASNRVLIGLSHSTDEPENVLIAYLMGVEALRAGKEAVMWLTKDGTEVALDGFADTIDVPGAPSIAALHDEYVNNGGGFLRVPSLRKGPGPRRCHMDQERRSQRRTSGIRIHQRRRPRLQLLICPQVESRPDLWSGFDRVLTDGHVIARFVLGHRSVGSASLH